MMDQKTFLVTGGNRGIGFQIIKTLNEMNDQNQIILTCRRPKSLSRDVKNYVEAHSNILLHELDVTNPRSVEKLKLEIVRNVKGIHGLINNAGVNYDTWNQAMTSNVYDLNDGRLTFETNFFGPWNLVVQFLPLLKNVDNASIVNVSSEAGSIHSMGAGTPFYSTSKAALNALTKIFSQELKSENISVNSVCPGWCRTDMGGMGGRDPALGAKSVVDVLMRSLKDSSITGKFFRDGREIPW